MAVVIQCPLCDGDVVLGVTQTVYARDEDGTQVVGFRASHTIHRCCPGSHGGNTIQPYLLDVVTSVSSESVERHQPIVEDEIRGQVREAISHPVTSASPEETPS